jgi:hypothetical protein
MKKEKQPRILVKRIRGHIKLRQTNSTEPVLIGLNETYIDETGTLQSVIRIILNPNYKRK